VGKVAKRVGRIGVVVVMITVTACETRDATPGRSSRPRRYGIGRTAAAAELAAIDIDVNPSGTGLPAGQGNAATGAAIYAGKCAACHGAKGEGIEKNPRLIGREPAAGYAFGTNVTAVKTIGNYWPYATTLYDYINRAMPLTAPGSLPPEEVYALVAFLLAENGVIAPETVIDAKSLPAVKMPAQPHFVTDNRKGGAGFR
jgi:S-disulfanyl-L-cysteine oxidoreductase SoxD